MTKLILVTHGDTATAMKNTTKMFFGKTADKIAVAEFHSNDSLGDFQRRIKDSIDNSEKNYIILVDIPSGTPYNVVAVIIDKYKETKNMQCLSGVNIPMVMEALASLPIYESMSKLTDHLMETGNQSIVNLRKKSNI